MKTNYFKFILLLFVSTFSAIAHTTDPKLGGRYTKEKKITKEYTVNANALLKINNSYGNVDVITWDQNRITIEVTVKTNGNDEDKVIKKLNDIDVKFQGDATMVSAITEISESNSSW